MHISRTRTNCSLLQTSYAPLSLLKQTWLFKKDVEKTSWALKLFNADRKNYHLFCSQKVHSDGGQAGRVFLTPSTVSCTLKISLTESELELKLLVVERSNFQLCEFRHQPSLHSPSLPPIPNIKQCIIETEGTYFLFKQLQLSIYVSVSLSLNLIIVQEAVQSRVLQPVPPQNGFCSLKFIVRKTVTDFAHLTSEQVALEVSRVVPFSNRDLNVVLSAPSCVRKWNKSQETQISRKSRGIGKRRLQINELVLMLKIAEAYCEESVPVVRFAFKSFPSQRAGGTVLVHRRKLYKARSWRPDWEGICCKPLCFQIGSRQ